MKVLTLRDTSTDAWVSVAFTDDEWAEKRARLLDLDELTKKLTEAMEIKERQNAPKVCDHDEEGTN